MEWITSPEAWVALATLTLLEIVLGVDNIIFISILVGRLPEAQRQRARLLGLGFAMGTRILLLLLLTWIMRLQATLFVVFDVGISGRDLILIGGGLFLLAKSTLEIHESLEGCRRLRVTRRSTRASSASSSRSGSSTSCSRSTPSSRPSAWPTISP